LRIAGSMQFTSGVESWSALSIGVRGAEVISSTVGFEDGTR